MSVAESEILWRVLVKPSDLGPRLVYADWLDENGQELRAEYIRIDIQIHKRPIVRNQFDLIIRRNELIKKMDGLGVKWNWKPEENNPYIDAVVRNGMVEELSLQCVDFMRYAKEVFSLHPIRKVMLADRTPYPANTNEESFFWDTKEGSGSDWIDEPHLLPPELLYAFTKSRNKPKTTYPHEYVESFSTEALAEKWLSKACIKVGREMAGLPPLRAVK